MGILNDALMEILQRFQELITIPAYAGIEMFYSDIESMGCRSSCSGDCDDSCSGGCEDSCAGSCEDSCSGSCDSGTSWE
ncbi:MAG TPA: hypothetical protein DDY31_18925 [Lachnospiraceae bacterium]|nr:hypothetical protein [Lachnospiraceae bacterium]